MVVVEPLGIRAVRAFGKSSSPALSRTGKNSRAVTGKCDMRTAAVEGPSLACMQGKAKVRVSIYQGQP